MFYEFMSLRGRYSVEVAKGDERGMEFSANVLGIYMRQAYQGFLEIRGKRLI